MNQERVKACRNDSNICWCNDDNFALGHPPSNTFNLVQIVPFLNKVCDQLGISGSNKLLQDSPDQSAFSSIHCKFQWQYYRKLCTMVHNASSWVVCAQLIYLKRPLIERLQWFIELSLQIVQWLILAQAKCKIQAH